VIGTSISWFRRGSIINTNGLRIWSSIIAYNDTWPYGYSKSNNEIVSNQKIKYAKHHEQYCTCTAYESNSVVAYVKEFEHPHEE